MKAELADKLLEFIYPSRCIICGSIIHINKEIKICPRCENAIVRNEPPFCASCGKHIEGDDEVCVYCGGKGFVFDRGGALWPYEGRQIRAVLDLKFNRILQNAKSLGILCADDIIGKKLSENIDVIIPVPLHRSKLRQRGYNQAEIIASVIGRRLGIAVDGRLLARVKKTEPQMALDFESRLENITNCMEAVRPEDIAGKSVLLIDDIFTTGATLNECAKELKKAGAVTVNCFCVCIAHDKTSLYQSS